MVNSKSSRSGLWSWLRYQKLILTECQAGCGEICRDNAK